MQKKYIKYILIISLGIIILTKISLATSQKKQEQRELDTNFAKNEINRYSEFTNTLQSKFTPDTTVGKISLLDTINVNEYLGKDVMDKLIDEPFYNYSVYSNDTTQRFTVYFHPGGYKNEFAEFKVDYVKNKPKNIIVVNDHEFVTESNIKLGITIRELKTIKGEPDSITKNKTTKLHYKIDNFKNSKFLKRHNYSSYYADYEFKNGYLIEFKFGFEYP